MNSRIIPKSRVRPRTIRFSHLAIGVAFIAGVSVALLLFRNPSSYDRRFDHFILPPVYNNEPAPRLSAIVQSFNHLRNINNISTALITSPLVDEIVVCEDGSSDGSLKKWADVLTGIKHFVIRSNNLHEMRAYNRALRVVDGEFILLLQDDDLLPSDDTWIRNAIQLLRTYPDIGILGGYIGQTWDRSGGYEFGEQTSTHGGVRKGNTKPILWIQPRLNIPFMFVECAWNAPLFVRRDLVFKSGGLDLNIANRGEPGVWQDCVWAYHAWSLGFKVAVFNAPFIRGVGGHGSAATKEKLRLRDVVWKRAVSLTNRKFNRKVTHRNVLALNRRLLRKRTSFT